MGSPDEIIARTKNTICSAIDINSAFTHVKIKEEHQGRTAFFVGRDLYQWCRMTQGLCSAPGTFSLLMSRVFSKKTSQHLHDTLGEDVFPQRWVEEPWIKNCSYYIDDIVIHSEPPPSEAFGSQAHLLAHAEHTRKVLLALRYADLRVSGAKSDWCTTKFRLLGFQIDTQGNTVGLTHQRAKAILSTPKPANLSDVQIQLATLQY